MTDRETIVLVKLLPDHIDLFIEDGHVYLRGPARVLIGHTLELEHDIEIEVDAEPGDATTGRWRSRFLGAWKTGPHWGEEADDGSGS